MSKVPTLLALGNTYDLGYGGRAQVWMGGSAEKQKIDSGKVNR
jgi:hypothetical protein